MKLFWVKIKRFLKSLSFRTGVISLFACVIFYLLSFAVIPLSISASLRTVLWVILFGLAKTTQYIGIVILGKEGLTRLKRAFRKPHN